MRIPPSYRVADLNNEAAKNLMPWVMDALSKQNELALPGRNGETRQARCWETGVPDIHLKPGRMHIIQTPKEVVMFHRGARATSGSTCRIRPIRNRPGTENRSAITRATRLSSIPSDSTTRPSSMATAHRTPQAARGRTLPADRWRQYARSRLHGRRPRRVLSAVVGVAESSPGGGLRTAGRRNSTAPGPMRIISTSVSNRCRPLRSSISKKDAARAAQDEADEPFRRGRRTLRLDALRAQVKTAPTLSRRARRPHPRSRRPVGPRPPRARSGRGTDH